MSQLLQVKLPLTSEYISPGSLQPTRAKLLSASKFLFSTENSLYCYEVPSAQDMLSNKDLFSEGKKASLVSAPVLISDVEYFEIPLGRKDLSEIQSIDFFDNRIAVVDSRGRGCVIDVVLSGEEKVISSNSTFLSYEFQFPKLDEHSWSGISISRQNRDLIVAVHSFSRQVVQFQMGNGAMIASGLGFSFTPPTAISFLSTACSSGSNLVAVAEGSELCIYNLSLPPARACIQRLNHGSPGSTIFTISTTPDNVTFSGSDGCVVSVETEAWAARHKVFFPCKYDIIGCVAISERKSVYSCGSDQEVLCGSWDAVTDEVDRERKKHARHQKRIGGGAGSGRSLDANNNIYNKPVAPAGDLLLPDSSASDETEQVRKRAKIDVELSSPHQNSNFDNLVVNENEPVEMRGPPKRIAISGQTGFRGERRWSGFDVIYKGLNDGDILLAISEGGYAYIVGNAQEMNMHAHALSQV